MQTGLIVFIIFMVLMFIGMIVAFILIIRFHGGAGVKVPANSEIFLFMHNTDSSGYSVCVCVGKKPSDYPDRNLYVMKPLDLGYNSKNKPVKEKPFEVAIRRDLIRSFPAGGSFLSLRRNINFVVPDSHTKFDDEFLRTEFGQFCLLLTKKAQSEDKISEVVKDTDERVKNEMALKGKEEHEQLHFWKSATDSVLRRDSDKR